MKTPRVAVIGAGAFGRNHLRVYRDIEAADPGALRLTAIVEPDPSRRSELASKYDLAGFASLDEALQADAAPPFDAASVCSPTIHHAAVAERLLEAGIDVLIEKPFAATIEQADRVLALAERNLRIVQIGHLERFNPAVTAAAERITRPMFFEAHRLSIFTPRSLDVDVVLDLMIHDLDVVLSLTNSPVREVRAVGLPVLSPKVDIANVRVEFESGCVANFTASRVSTEQVRKLRLFQPHEYLSLDFARQELLTIKVDPSLLAQLMAGGPSMPAEGSHPSRGLSLEKLDPSGAEPLRLELEDFLSSVRYRTRPRVTGEAGRAALALALEINQQIAGHAHRAGLA
ncbi:MAG TPA: Gfo/Idh/MocA family oxidoreductase [Bryocella sp.]|nr:Gfo/Idh/MocA family oxidoreductase [Bryocella sp.]